jgi:hypothetical protein
MRNTKKYVKQTLLLVLAFSILGGCGGYARSPNSGSGVETYGAVDVGVSHGRN